MLGICPLEILLFIFIIVLLYLPFLLLFCFMLLLYLLYFIKSLNFCLIPVSHISFWTIHNLLHSFPRPPCWSSMIFSLNILNAFIFYLTLWDTFKLIFHKFCASILFTNASNPDINFGFASKDIVHFLFQNAFFFTSVAILKNFL